jgi:hypothetical protein
MIGFEKNLEIEGVLKDAVRPVSTLRSMFTEAGLILGVMVAVVTAARASSWRRNWRWSRLRSAARRGRLLVPAARWRKAPPRTRHQPHLHHRHAVHEPPEGVGRRGVRRARHPAALHRQRALLAMLSLVLLVPGALTGAGSVTVLIAGGMVATVLGYMGIARVRVAAIVFIIAGLSAAAPPVSLWAMMTAAGVNMPYVGFFWPLLLPCLFAALFTIFLLGWKGTTTDIDKALTELPEAPAGMACGRCWRRSGCSSAWSSWAGSGRTRRPGRPPADVRGGGLGRGRCPRALRCARRARHDRRSCRCSPR